LWQPDQLMEQMLFQLKIKLVCTFIKHNKLKNNDFLFVYTINLYCIVLYKRRLDCKKSFYSFKCTKIIRLHFTRKYYFSLSTRISCL